MKAITLISTSPLQMHCSPDSAIINRGNPWFIPEQDTDGPTLWQARLYAAAVVDRLGRSISARFAHRYYSELALCAHFNSPDAPRALAWMRDGALLCGDARIPVGTDMPWPQKVVMRQGAAIYLPTPQDFDQAIQTVSEYITIRTGDLILLPVSWPALPITVHADLDFTDTDGRLLLRIKPR